MESEEPVQSTETEQNGRPYVIFLHGFLGNAQEWGPIAMPLLKWFHCLSLDLPGHGTSDVTDEAFTVPGCAIVLAQTLAKHQVRECYLVGYSMGARVALFMAIHFPQLVKRIVIESGSPGLKTEEERRERWVLDDWRARQLESKPFEDFLDDWYNQPIFKSLHRHPAGLAELKNMRMENDPTKLAKSLRLMSPGLQESLWGDLPDMRVKALFLAGELDPKYAALAYEMAEKVPGSKVQIFPDCGHILHLEKTTQYIDAVKDFLLG